MATEYNISNLFLEAFGLKVRDGYNVGISQDAQEPKGLFSGINIIEKEDEAFQMSSYGTPILFPIEFLKGSYKQYNQKGEIIQMQMSTLRLPIASIVSFSREKLIGVTKINGGNGTVKEIFGFDDWQIRIDGILIPDNSQPQGLYSIYQQETELLKWEKLGSSIDVGGEPFHTRRIRSLTLKSFNVQPMRGRPNIRTFTIDALSDEPIELNIKTKV